MSFIFLIKFSLFVYLTYLEQLIIYYVPVWYMI